MEGRCALEPVSPAGPGSRSGSRWAQTLRCPSAAPGAVKSPPGSFCGCVPGSIFFSLTSPQPPCFSGSPLNTLLSPCLPLAASRGLLIYHLLFLCLFPGQHPLHERDFLVDGSAQSRRCSGDNGRNLFNWTHTFSSCPSTEWCFLRTCTPVPWSAAAPVRGAQLPRTLCGSQEAAGAVISYVVFPVFLSPRPHHRPP